MSYKRKHISGRIIFTAAVLLTLVILTVCTLIGQRDSAEDTSAAHTTTSVEETDLLEAMISRPAAEQLDAFLPDYTSAVILNTTLIKDLSLEVGSDASQLRMNWMSPSDEPGCIRWTDTVTGETTDFTADCEVSATVSGCYLNKATATDLEPGVTYRYQVGNDTAWSPVYSYQAPQQTDTLTFLVTSDAQIGQSDMEISELTADRWDRVLNRLTTYVPEANFIFHLGDQVADFGCEKHYRLFLDHLPLYRIALAPVVGNHDVANSYTTEEYGRPGNTYFYDHFNVPNRSEMGQSESDKDGNYYFIRNDVLFIVLNSLTASGGDEQEQYVKQIVNEHPDTRWRILAEHFPAYSGAQNSGSNVGEYLPRIAADYQIDLVLTGHDHVYSRSAFTNRDSDVLTDYNYAGGAVAVNPVGPMYLTCGTSSGCLYHFPKTEEHIVYQGQVNSPMGIRIDVNEEELHIRSYLVDTWTMFDEYTIRKDDSAS